MSDFSDRIDQLIADTPSKIKGGVKVDQVYAHYQHAHPEFHHPDGGEAFYLQTPLFAKAERYMERLAKGAVTERGSELRDAMIKNMEDLSMEVFERAPWEFGDLRASGNPTVEEDGEVVYDRAPNCKRLDKDELKIKAHLRYLFDPHRYAYDRSEW